MGKLDEGGVRLCGASGCRATVYDEVRPLHDAIWSGRVVAPALAQPYYSVTLTDRRGRPLSHSPAYYYVPAARAIRDGFAAFPEWRRAGAALARAARGIAPFRAPRVVAGDVDGQAVRDPGSYIRLWKVVAPARAIADPAGRQPRVNGWGRLDDAELRRYWGRVHRHWLPVNLWTGRPSPWSDGNSFVWVGRRRDLIKRDGQIVRVRHDLAERVRRGLSLRVTTRGLSP
jgi:hypothetical protein